MSDETTDPAAPVSASTVTPLASTVSTTGSDIDLDLIEADLNDVQTALDRLNDGTYWIDEATGEPLGDEVLAAHPTARTASPQSTRPPHSPQSPQA